MTNKFGIQPTMEPVAAAVCPFISGEFIRFMINDVITNVEAYLNSKNVRFPRTSLLLFLSFPDAVFMLVILTCSWQFSTCQLTQKNLCYSFKTQNNVMDLLVVIYLLLCKVGRYFRNARPPWDRQGGYYSNEVVEPGAFTP